MRKMAEDKGFFKLMWDAFCSLGAKVKLIIAGIVGILGFIAIFVMRKNMNARQILELELKKIRTELKIEQKQKDIDLNEQKIKVLEDRESEIKKELEELDRESPRESVSKEELDEFFDERGF